jgi:mono/diheme cytochrome c family protein
MRPNLSNASNQDAREGRKDAVVLAVGIKQGAAARADGSSPVLAGKAVARACRVNCHIVTAGQATGGDQAPTWSNIADRPGTNSDSLHALLAKPRGAMPDFKLGGQDIDNVTAYILSLKH